MNKEKIYRYGQLKRLEEKLKSLYSKSYNRIYESKDKNIKIISDNDNKNILSKIPKEIIELLKLNNEIINKDNTISINNYWDILDTIKILLNIIEYDLIRNYIDN